MSLKQLPPVGTPVHTGSRNISAEPLTIQFNGFLHTFLQSGTAALALALTQLVKRADNVNRNVIIPGYGCPDLVAACEFAGVQAVSVDFDPNLYQYDLTQIEKLDGSLLAVICPSLLGISMPIKCLREILSDDVFIIEDNAQWFPEHEQAAQRVENLRQLGSYQLPTDTQYADFFITSFGRGKPVNLMGGGLLAWQSRYQDWFEGYQLNDVKTKHLKVDIKTQLKARLFNIVCHPIPYGLLARIPALKLGVTAYHKLDKITDMEREKVSLAGTAIQHYLSQPQHISELLKKNLPLAWPQQAENKRLLRLPLLASSKEVRDAIVTQCNAHGLGASVMYEKPLIDIENVRDKVSTPFPTPIAEKVANGFFTLPLHPGVTVKHVEKMIKIITPYFNDLNKVPQ
ncbi:DegT/DnrJ/EryC1/StrS family aminotransferase [Alteromonas ponticola]|uniref:DegT/DnrJ/EryC1/StrS family aminotransferase n=1 Tax=Alteromonas aquimaris TaxID=2998417 RepID=A0ABT3P587_9ALTE|nr:DegT/DnrJ/EryC1/StrS family aminotransferase [Alteromonas aquimaris]MCW8107251.1 DegT/DnrJ/EryC1/StrS family aminotransferase [Alteromonas aquimaris]